MFFNGYIIFGFIEYNEDNTNIKLGYYVVLSGDYCTDEHEEYIQTNKESESDEESNSDKESNSDDK